MLWRVRASRAAAEAGADERARQFGLDGPAIRRSQKTLSTASNLLILVAGVGLATAIWITRNSFDLLNLLAALLLGSVLVALIALASFAASAVMREWARAVGLAAAGGIGVAGYFVLFAILGRGLETVLGLLFSAVASVALVWSTPSGVLTTLRRDKPSLSSDLHRIATVLPDWQTGLSGRVRPLVVYGVLLVVGQLAEVAAVYFVPSAVALIAVLAGAVTAATYLLRRRVALVLSIAAAYPVVLLALTVTLS